MSYLEDLYTLYMNGGLTNMEDPSLYDNTDGNNPIYGTPVEPTGKSMYPSKKGASSSSPSVGSNYIASGSHSKDLSLDDLIAKTGGDSSDSSSESDSGGDVQTTANSITGGSSSSPVSTENNGDLGRSYLQQVLKAGDVTKNPWVTDKSLMDKIANYTPTNTKQIAYQNLLDNLPSLVSGGSWFAPVNDKMIALSGLLQKAQSDSLVEDANIKDGVAKNGLANEVLNSLRGGNMSNPQEYASLMKMLSNIGAGKYDPKDVDTLFITPDKQANMKQSASATSIADDNQQKQLAQAEAHFQQNQALQERLASVKQANAPDKLGKSILDVGDFANTWGASLKDPKDISNLQDKLKSAFISAKQHSPEAMTYIGQAGIRFSQAHGLQDDANSYAQAMGINQPKQDSGTGIMSNILGGLDSYFTASPKFYAGLFD